VTGISSFHPIAQTCGPDRKLEATRNTAITFNGLLAGLYGFYCPNHADSMTGQGMGLALQIVP